MQKWRRNKFDATQRTSVMTASVSHHVSLEKNSDMRAIRAAAWCMRDNMSSTCSARGRFTFSSLQQLTIRDVGGRLRSNQLTDATNEKKI